jgi:polysaccharide export outer membrane protein
MGKLRMIGRRWVTQCSVAFLAGGCLAGCTNLPASGPYPISVVTGSTTTLAADRSVSQLEYALVDLTSNVLQYAGATGPSSLFRSFGGGRGSAPEILVGIGDRVQIAIFEASTGGLFIPADAGSRPGNFVTLPPQTVDAKGFISVPYGGQIRANRRSVPDIQRDIEQRLATRAIEPQAIVTLVEQRSSEVTVVGEVNLPNKFAITPSGERVLDVISRAGGLRQPGYDSFVTLNRGGRTATIYFNNLMRNSQENVFVLPGDTVYVYREQRTFLAFGASGLNGQFNFESERVSMAEGVAKAGGLLDNRADHRQDLMYRIEDRNTLEKIGVNLEKFDPEASAIPTIYRTNLRDPAGFFLAQTFQLRNKDVLYVSNSDSVELIKFLTVLDAVSGTVANVATDAVVTRDAVKELQR